VIFQRFQYFLDRHQLYDPGLRGWKLDPRTSSVDFLFSSCSKFIPSRTILNYRFSTFFFNRKLLLCFIHGWYSWYFIPAYVEFISIHEIDSAVCEWTGWFNLVVFKAVVDLSLFCYLLLHIARFLMKAAADLKQVLVVSIFRHRR
jgi:hypothetical protein